MKYKLIKIDGYWIIVSNEEIKPNELFFHKFTISIKLNNDITSIKHEEYFKLIASQNPEHNLSLITFSDEVAKELGIIDEKKDEETWRDLFQLFIDNMIKDKKYTQEEWLKICKKNWSISEK